MYAQSDTGEAIMATKEWFEIFRLDVVETRKAWLARHKVPSRLRRVGMQHRVGYTYGASQHRVHFGDTPENRTHYVQVPASVLNARCGVHARRGSKVTTRVRFTSRPCFPK